MRVLLSRAAVNHVCVVYVHRLAVLKLRLEVQHLIILHALRLGGLVLRELVSSPLQHVLRLGLDVGRAGRHIGAEFPLPVG